MTNAIEEIKNLVQKINKTWSEGKPELLVNYFHEDIIFNSPDFSQKIEGKANCIESYIDFCNTSKVLLYNDKNLKVDIFDSTAIASYEFEMKYEHKGSTYHESGNDIFVFHKFENEWKAVWRSMVNMQNL